MTDGPPTEGGRLHREYRDPSQAALASEILSRLDSPGFIARGSSVLTIGPGFYQGVSMDVLPYFLRSHLQSKVGGSLTVLDLPLGERDLAVTGYGDIDALRKHMSDIFRTEPLPLPLSDIAKIIYHESDFDKYVPPQRFNAVVDHLTLFGWIRSQYMAAGTPLTRIAERVHSLIEPQGKVILMYQDVHGSATINESDLDATTFVNAFREHFKSVETIPIRDKYHLPPTLLEALLNARYPSDKIDMKNEQIEPFHPDATFALVLREPV